MEPEVFFTTWNQIKVKGDYEFLVPLILDKLWHLWELDKVTNSGQILKVPSSVISEILALNRAIFPTSERKIQDWYQGTILPKLFNTEPKLVNPTRLYRSLDRILLKKEEIQDHLARKVENLGYDDLSLVFYDITSSYFEGWGCPIVEFGLSRDYRKDRLQLLLALGITRQGFPFYWKVLQGGLHDSVTLKEVAASLKKRFKIGNTILVMDKGIVSQDNLDFLEKERFRYIITIPRNQVKNLPDFPEDLLRKLGKELEKEEEKKNPDLARVMKRYPYFTYLSPRAYFHELKKEGERRYVFCFNPEKFLEERKQRKEKLTLISSYLARWNEKLAQAKYSKDRQRQALTKEVYHYLTKRKVETLFTLRVVPKRKRIKKRTITTYTIDCQIKADKLASLKLSDGIYCIVSNLPQEKTSSFLISSYRQRRKVEVAFSYLKGFIELRPFYHQKAERVKAHILICILGYLLQVTVEYLLRKKGYHLTFQEFYQKVSKVRAVELVIENIKREKLKLTEAPKEVLILLEILNSKDILSKVD